MSISELMFGCRLLLLSVVAPLLASAQAITGGSGGTLSDRANYSAFYRGHPDSIAVDLIVILRGAPGWNRAGSHARESMGPVSPSSRFPVRHSLTIGSTTFEYSYQPRERILRLGDTWLSLDSSNVVIIDRVDGVGGPPTVVGRLTLRLSSINAHTLSDSLRQIPALQEFIR